MGVRWFQGAGTTGGGSAAAGAILGTNQYNPGGATTFDTTFPAAASEISSPNNRLTFTVPANGKALIHLCAMAYAQCTGAGALYYWQLVNNATVLQVGVNTSVLTQAPATPDDIIVSIHAVFVLTGLTPGALTLRWYHGVSVNGLGRIYTGGGNYAPMFMFAQSLPT